MVNLEHIAHCFFRVFIAYFEQVNVRFLDMKVARKLLSFIIFCFADIVSYIVATCVECKETQFRYKFFLKIFLFKILNIYDF